ncbi:protein kinase C-binding protein NELL1-like isoform X2 [Prorops nasuta]|uniref:protein kinase C-binding protein NELL1-like isoform X2 n=1 Tax=Prorops nasuta TaxID=863751 RepID=UPI0034CFC34A
MRLGPCSAAGTGNTASDPDPDPPCSRDHLETSSSPAGTARFHTRTTVPPSTSFLEKGHHENSKVIFQPIDRLHHGDRKCPRRTAAAAATFQSSDYNEAATSSNILHPPPPPPPPHSTSNSCPHPDAGTTPSSSSSSSTSECCCEPTSACCDPFLRTRLPQADPRSSSSSSSSSASSNPLKSTSRRRRTFLIATVAAFLALAVSTASSTSNEKEEETAVASVQFRVVTEESSTMSSSSSSITGVLGAPRLRIPSGDSGGGGIDLLALLQLHNSTRRGVTQVPGLVRLRPAYYLQGEERELRLSESSFERAARLLRRVPEFTIAAALKQEEANSGTIVAFSHGNNRYLELQSSGRKDELRLHYVSRRDGSVHVEAFPFRLADGAWHRLALSISGSQVELLVDCHPLYRRLLRPGPPDTNFTLPQLQLWIGQRNVRHFLFKGTLQDVKLIPGAHGYLSQCPQLDSSCPTCGQFSMLQNTVDQLMHNLNELTRRLAAAEGRISKVEECECQKSCRANGTVHEDGATWEKDCQQCACVHGEIQCRPTPCLPVTCKNPVTPSDQCCPICLKECYLHGVIYDHGEKVSPKQCVECDCYDGSFTCQRFDTEIKCPPLPCPPSEQISVAEECCKFCPDVDECKQEGGSEGHHCNANTRCVNVIGSYTCECLPGYQRVDKFNCAELDECATGHHACNEHATCVNTAGSYYCVCKEGYAGDGYTCKPICKQTCQNGGVCVSPGRCSCRRGYIGNSCELDLDECASELHRCDESSTCFNMPGWYYCRCKPGYRSALHESTQGTQCLDIDECNDQTIERRHTCHPSAKCVNTEGGYRCVCPRTPITHDLDDHLCRLSCWFEGREVGNGESVAPAGNPCRRCTCKDGVVTCREPTCDCSAPGSNRDKCCPQCDPAASCRHQELHHLVFRSGERWIYQCQTCECLYGEIDCWQMECPPVNCFNPVTEDGDCCPRCEDDPCARELFSNITSISVPSGPRPCSYAGMFHESGSAWQDPHDKCTTCECKVPYCAQLVSNSACCVHRTGSYAAATIMAALAIWASSSSSNVLQSLMTSLLSVAYRMTLRSQRWMTSHRKQLYQRSALPSLRRLLRPPHRPLIPVHRVHHQRQIHPHPRRRRRNSRSYPCYPAHHRRRRRKRRQTRRGTTSHCHPQHPPPTRGTVSRGSSRDTSSNPGSSRPASSRFPRSPGRPRPSTNSTRRRTSPPYTPLWRVPSDARMSLARWWPKNPLLQEGPPCAPPEQPLVPETATEARRTFATTPLEGGPPEEYRTSYLRTRLRASGSDVEHGDPHRSVLQRQHVENAASRKWPEIRVIATHETLSLINIYIYTYIYIYIYICIYI